MSNDLTHLSSPDLPYIPERDEGPRVYFCSLCSGNGTVMATKRGAFHSPYAFKCDCASGKRSKRNYPVWHSALGKEFEILKQGTR